MNETTLTVRSDEPGPSGGIVLLCDLLPNDELIVTLKGSFQLYILPATDNAAAPDRYSTRDADRHLAEGTITLRITEPGGRGLILRHDPSDTPTVVLHRMPDFTLDEPALHVWPGVVDPTTGVPAGMMLFEEIRDPAGRPVLRSDLGRFTRTDQAGILDVAARLQRAGTVCFHAVGDRELETIFWLRGLQLAERLPAGRRSVVALKSNALRLANGSFGSRVRHSWPFVDAHFTAAETEAARHLSSVLDVPVAPLDAAGPCRVDQLPRAVTSWTGDQPVAVQIQPLWERCGSTTAFENEIEALVGLGYFVLRLFVEPARVLGETLSHDVGGILRENAENAAAHLNALAIATLAGRDRLLTGIDPADLFGAFRNDLVAREACGILGPLAANLAARAEVVIVNHVVNLGFALRVCPMARVLLDVHDYFTRNRFERARLSADAACSRAQLKAAAELEAGLWRVADCCTNVNPAEQRLVGRHNPQSVIVLPRPYVPLAAAVQTDILWDLLLVADQHPFNVNSVRWFLDQVIAPRPDLAGLRIAIVGRVDKHLDPGAFAALPQVAFLGFVADLDRLRSTSRLSVIPDTGGTGIAVKTLTAIAAGHPIVTTRIGLRGLGADVARDLPAWSDAEGMARDIAALMTSDAALEVRRDCVMQVRQALGQGLSFADCVRRIRADAPDRSAARARLRRLIEQNRPALPAPVTIAAPEASVSFALGSTDTDLLIAGFHEGETWGRWTDGVAATMRLPVPDLPPTELRYTLEMRAPGQPVDFSLRLDGRPIDTWHVTRTVSLCSFSVGGLDKAPDRVLQLHVSASHRPGTDPRILGIGLGAVSIAPNQPYELGTAVDLRAPGKDSTLVVGWHPAEGFGRWTTEAAIIDLHLAQRPTLSLLLTLTHVPQHASDTIDLEINGHALPRRRLDDAILTWTLGPALFDDNRRARIGLRPTIVSRPPPKADAPDRRILGIAVSALRLDPAPSLYRRVRGRLSRLLAARLRR